MTKTATPQPLPKTILPPQSSNLIQTFYPTNLMQFFKALIVPNALKSDPKLDAAIFELLCMSIEAHFQVSGTPFDVSNSKNTLDQIFKNEDALQPFVLQNFLISNFSISYVQSTQLAFQLETLIEKKVGGQTVLKFEIFENIFNFLFPTFQDQVLLSQRLDANRLYNSGGMDVHRIIGLFQIRMIPFYTQFPSMQKIHDNAYLTINLIGLLLLNIAQKGLGTFKDAVFSILPKTLDRSQTEYVEKTAINTILNTIKPNIPESISLDSINVYRDLQAIYDCSLSFQSFYTISQKFQAVKNRLGNTQFLKNQINEVLEQEKFVEYLNRLKLPSITTTQPNQKDKPLTGTPETLTFDQIEITKCLILLEILCIDAFVLDQSFYNAKYDKQGLLNVLKAIPRLKSVDLSAHIGIFLHVYRSELDTWNYYAWNTDGSIRNAKNLVLKPVGPSPRRAQLQLSSAALVLDPLLKDTFTEFDASLDVFKGRTFYDIYRAFRSSVFVTSYYFDVTTYKYLKKDFVVNNRISIPIQAIYLFLVFCQYRIKDYALQNATLFEKTDVLESPSYSATKDVARTARYDMVYNPIIRTTIAMSLIILIDKLVTNDRKKHKVKK